MYILASPSQLEVELQQRIGAMSALAFLWFLFPAHGYCQEEQKYILENWRSWWRLTLVGCSVMSNVG